MRLVKFHTCASKLEYVERKRKREKEGKKGKWKEKRKEKGTAKILDGSFVETIPRDNIKNTTACSDQNIFAKLDVYYSGTVGQFNCIC